MTDPVGTIGASPGALEISMGVLGTTLPAGPQQDYITVPSNCYIAGWMLLGDQTGSVVLDIWNCANYEFDGGTTHPVVGDSICGGNPAAIVSGTSGQDTTLPGWMRNLVAGTVLGLNIISVTNIQKLTLSLQVLKTP